MASLPDIPGAVDDDLEAISPELVMVDPELARLVREREADPLAAQRALEAPRLRLLKSPEPAPVADAATAAPAELMAATATDGPRSTPPAADDEDLVIPRAVPIVPQPPADPGPDEGASSTEPERAHAAPAVPPAPRPPAEPVRVDVPPAVPAPVEAARAAERVVDAEPARVVEPQRRGAQTAKGELGIAPPVAGAAPVGPGAVAEAVAMPHPVLRPPGGARRRPRDAGASGRGRGALGFLVAVAAASLAVLGILELTGESSRVPVRAASPTSAVTGVEKVASGGPTSGGSSKPAPIQQRAAKKGNAGEKNAAGERPKKRPPAKAATRPATTAKPKAEKAAPKTPAVPKAPTATEKKTSEPPKPSKSASSATPSRAPEPPAAKTPSKPPAAKISPKPPAAKTPSKPAGTPPEPKRFAWAPVDGAVGYHVELFKGSDRVLVEETKEPLLELGPTWRYQGRVVRLEAGTYRWYVWPVTASGRTAQAVVQAKLSVP